MSFREKLASAGRIALSIALDPPGWIPAWVLTAVLILGQYSLLTAALHTDLDVARLEFGLRVVQLEADVYKTVLAIWLTYKGVGVLAAVVEAWRKKP